MNLFCLVGLSCLPLGQVGNGPSGGTVRPKKVMRKRNARDCAVGELAGVERRRLTVLECPQLLSPYSGLKKAAETCRGSIQSSRPGHA